MEWRVLPKVSKETPPREEEYCARERRMPSLREEPPWTTPTRSGATALLVDEDTCATNFMVRDDRMQRLVQREPITPPHTRSVHWIFEIEKT